jgi:hypothetical protein
MNTGIQDAANLGWKLAFATRSSDPDGLLATYEAERRPVAQETLALTHLLFWAESGTGPLPALLRGGVAPLAAPLIPALLRNRTLTGAGLRALSGVRIRYPRSRLSMPGGPVPSGVPRPGYRVADRPVECDGVRRRLHDLLDRPGVHLLLPEGAAPAVAGPWVHPHRLTGWPGAAVVAVRPDGHVGFRGAPGDADALRRWLSFAGASAG